MKVRYIVASFFLALLISSCGENTPSVETPESYAFARDGASTVSFSGQTTRILMATELTAAMTDFEQSEVSLLQMFSNMTANGTDADPYSDISLNESTKSVQSKIAASEDFFSSNTEESSTIKSTLRSWIESQVREVYPNKDQLAAAGIPGQIADGSDVRYINAQGLEYNQAVAKSIIGALMVDQICNNYLSTAVLDAGTNIIDNNTSILEDGKNYTTMEHKWDEAYGYLFGTSSDPADPITLLGEDEFLSKYLSRVESDADFTGIAADIYNAFKLGRAAIVAQDYTVRDAQAEILREKISMLIAIRAVYYLQQGKNAIATNNYGGAFHDLSEGYGFIYSLRFTRNANSIDSDFTRTEVDDYIDRLMEGNGFWDVSAQALDDISEEIAARYSFTVAQAAN